MAERHHASKRKPAAARPPRQAAATAPPRAAGWRVRSHSHRPRNWATVDWRVWQPQVPPGCAPTRQPTGRSRFRSQALADPAGAPAPHRPAPNRHRQARKSNHRAMAAVTVARSCRRRRSGRLHCQARRSSFLAGLGRKIVQHLAKLSRIKRGDCSGQNPHLCSIACLVFALRRLDGLCDQRRPDLDQSQWRLVQRLKRPGGGPPNRARKRFSTGSPPSSPARPPIRHRPFASRKTPLLHGVLPRAFPAARRNLFPDLCAADSRYHALAHCPKTGQYRQTADLSVLRY